MLAITSSRRSGGTTSETLKITDSPVTIIIEAPNPLYPLTNPAIKTIVME